MKYLSQFILLFLLGLSIQVQAQLASEVSIVDLQVNRGNKSVAFSLAINTPNAGDILYLADADFVLEFNSQYFSDPEFTIETTNGESYCTFVSDTYTDSNAAATKTNVQAPSHDNIAVDFTRGNRLIINYIADATDNPTEFQEKAPRIDHIEGQHILGRFKISGISDKYGTLGLTWLCAGIQRTKIATYTPNTSISSTLPVVCKDIGDISLPIVLKDFWLLEGENDLNLHWETLTETNFHGFFLERSTNGIDFQSIKFLEGRGSETTGASYQYTDAEILRGQTYYYRLRMEDRDKSIQYSKIISGMLTTEVSVSLGPNPAQNHTQVLFDSADNGIVQISLYNSIGQRVHSINHLATRGFNNVKLALKDLASGMYWVEVLQHESKGGSRLVILNGDY